MARLWLEGDDGRGFVWGFVWGFGRGFGRVFGTILLEMTRWVGGLLWVIVGFCRGMVGWWVGGFYSQHFCELPLFMRTAHFSANKGFFH
jgi:hypothetical protein